MSKRQPESEIVDQIVSWLRMKGCFVFIVRNGATYSPTRGRFLKPGKRYTPGIADIVGVTKRGQFISVEVKQPGNKPTGDQLAFLVDVKRNKGIAIVAHSLEEARNLLIDELHA